MWELQILSQLRSYNWFFWKNFSWLTWRFTTYPPVSAIILSRTFSSCVWNDYGCCQINSGSYKQHNSSVRCWIFNFETVTVGNAISRVPCKIYDTFSLLKCIYKRRFKSKIVFLSRNAIYWTKSVQYFWLLTHDLTRGSQVIFFFRIMKKFKSDTLRLSDNWDSLITGKS